MRETSQRALESLVIDHFRFDFHPSPRKEKTSLPKIGKEVIKTREWFGIKVVLLSDLTGSGLKVISKARVNINNNGLICKRKLDGFRSKGGFQEGSPDFRMRVFTY